VHCKTNAKDFSFVFASDGLEVKLKNMARKGKANKELVSRFKKILKTPVSIVSGASRHDKIMLVENTTVQKVKELLQ